MQITVFIALSMSVNNIHKSQTSEGQALKTETYRRVTELKFKSYNIILGWAPSHKGIERNKEADRAAK